MRRRTEGPRRVRAGRRHVRQVTEDGEARTVGGAGPRLLAGQRPARIGNGRTGIARRQLVDDARDVGEMDGVVQDDDARLQRQRADPVAAHDGLAVPAVDEHEIRLTAFGDQRVQDRVRLAEAVVDQASDDGDDPLDDGAVAGEAGGEGRATERQIDRR